METKKDKKKKSKKGNTVGIVSVIMGAIIGVLIVECMESANNLPESFGWFELVFLMSLVLASYIHIIVHEAGHLVFGLLSGYHFTSFRIGSFMWIKMDGKLKCKRFSLAGTGGQCLMSPPDLVDGKIPCMLYNLGGSITNLVVALISVFLCLAFKNNWVLFIFFLFMAFVGVMSALLNGIPMQSKMINNDGYNALSLGKDKSALRAFWIQMKANAQIAKGERLGDMPAEWFAVPTDEEMNNSMVSVLGVFACNRLMDEHKFQEADALMERLLAMESSIVDLHKKLLVCDRIYCNLILGNPEEAFEELYDFKLIKFMKTMKNYPSVIRTKYVIALLYDNKADEAEKIKQQFEKVARTYPYPSEVEAEQELMEIAREKA